MGTLCTGKKAPIFRHGDTWHTILDRNKSNKDNLYNRKKERQKKEKE